MCLWYFVLINNKYRYKYLVTYKLYESGILVDIARVMEIILYPLHICIYSLQPHGSSLKLIIYLIGIGTELFRTI